MAGLSLEFFLASSVALIVLSVALVGWLATRGDSSDEGAPARINLLRHRWLARVIRWRPLQFVARLPFVLVFLLVIVAGFIGSQEPGRNIAPVLTWTIWWAALIIVIPLLGKIWCFVCPWNAIAEWIQRLTFWRVKDTGISLSFPWPARLRNLYPAIGLFLILTWLELGFGVTTSGIATAGLAVLIVILAVVPALYFDRKPFCRYACLVGMVSGAYAHLAMLEVRAGDKGVCRTCRTKDCVNGNERGYGCPVSVYPGTMDRDTYCIQCTECAKTCPKGNIAFNLRSFASSVIPPAKLRLDEAYMVLVVLGLTFFHSIAMTYNWMDAVHWAHGALGGNDWGLVLGFSIGMLVVLVVPGLVYVLGVAVARRTSAVGASLRTVFIAFVYALLPVALFYHLAHNLQHLLREGQALVPLLSDPLGWGWNLFGTAGMQLSPVLSLGSTQVLQVLLVVLGNLLGISLAFRIVRAWGIAESGGLRALLPLATVIVVLSIANLLLLAAPMQMRIGDAMPGHQMPGAP
ncbi:MAG: 4Fe-4S binding protein [Chloroflexi bacterium]|nr:4Fe-4S binding protein [Chloroflexota bacterium]